MDAVKREAWRMYYRQEYSRVKREVWHKGGVEAVNLEVAKRWKSLGGKGRRVYYDKIRSKLMTDAQDESQGLRAHSDEQKNESDENRESTKKGISLRDVRKRRIGGNKATGGHISNKETGEKQKDAKKGISLTKAAGKIMRGTQEKTNKNQPQKVLEVIDLDGPESEGLLEGGDMIPLKRKVPHQVQEGNDLEELQGVSFCSKKPSVDYEAWPRGLGTRMMICTATSSGNDLVRWGDQVVLSPVVPKSVFPMRGGKKLSGTVRFSCRGREVGRLPGATGRALAPAMLAGFLEVQAKVVHAPKKVMALSQIVLELGFWITKSAFEGEKGVSAGSKNTIARKSSSKRKGSSESEQSMVDHERVALVKLLNQLALGNIDNQKDKAASEEAIQEKIPDLTKNPESAEAFYATVEQLDQKHLDRLAKVPPIDGLRSTLRDYQRLGVSWMLEREWNSDTAHPDRSQSTEAAISPEEDSGLDANLPALWSRRKFVGGNSFFINGTVGQLSLEIPSGIEKSPCGGILSDEMGLGKTVEVIGTILAGLTDEFAARALPLLSKETCGGDKPKNSKEWQRGGTLIVVPMSMLRQWFEEFETHVKPGFLRVVEYYGGSRASTISIRDADVVITTYGTLAAEFARRKQGHDRNVESFFDAYGTKDGGVGKGAHPSKSMDNDSDFEDNKEAARRTDAEVQKTGDDDTEDESATEDGDCGYGRKDESDADDSSSGGGEEEGDPEADNTDTNEVEESEKESDGDDKEGAERQQKEQKRRSLPTGGLLSLHWWRVVLDEAHSIKGRTTNFARAAYQLQAEKRWAVTGTPIQNSLNDAFSLLHYLRIDPWAEWAYWNSAIVRKFESNEIKSKQQAVITVRNILGRVMLRRKKSTKDLGGNPLLELTKKEVRVVKVFPSTQEKEFYDMLYRRSKTRFDAFVAQGKVLSNFATVLEILLRLRQCCDHPYLVLSAQCKDPTLEREMKKLAKAFLKKDGVDCENTDDEPKGMRLRTIHTVQRENKFQKSTLAECPICLDPVDDGVYPSECSHACCRDCFDGVFRGQVKAYCPTCRTTIWKENLVPLPNSPKFNFDIKQRWWSSAKLIAVLQVLKELDMKRRKEGEIGKAVVFSQWTSMLDLVEIALNKEKMNFLRLDGSCSQSDRAYVLSKFANEHETNPDTANVMLLSLKAGGVGLNLTSASAALLLDPWWNPAVEEQAMDRIHRIGQNRDVIVHRFIIHNSVEERLLEVQERKQDVADGALASASDADRRQARLGEVMHLFSR